MSADQRPMRLLFGGVAGLVVAAFVRGAIGYLAQIESRLHKVTDQRVNTVTAGDRRELTL